MTLTVCPTNHEGQWTCSLLIYESFKYVDGYVMLHLIV